MEKHPAPTLAEILDELAKMEVVPQLNEIFAMNGKMIYTIIADDSVLQGENSAEVVLRMWLHMNRRKRRERTKTDGADGKGKGND